MLIPDSIEFHDLGYDTDLHNALSMYCYQHNLQLDEVMRSNNLHHTRFELEGFV